MNTNSDEMRVHGWEVPPGPSRLFLLRMWLDGADNPGGPRLWFSRVMDPVTGWTVCLHSWTELQQAITKMMATHQED